MDNVKCTINKDNIIKTKSFDFALHIIHLYKYLIDSKKEFVLSKQVLRSGTAIGANIEEADSTQSRKDFIARLSISLKEAKETHYWLRLLHSSDFIDNNMFDSIEKDCNEVIALLTSDIKSARNNL